MKPGRLNPIQQLLVLDSFRGTVMKGLQVTLLILFGCAFSTQAIRHIHVYTIGYEEPVLATVGPYYGVTQEVQLQESTDELLAEYEAIEREIEQIRDQNADKELYAIRQENMDVFARRDALASELNQREAITREIRDTWIFCAAGLILIGAGSMLYSRGLDWVGMSLILPGFLELMWWSAPSFTLGGAVREYDILLVNKIILTTISIVLMYTLWALAQRKRAGERSKSP